MALSAQNCGTNYSCAANDSAARGKFYVYSNGVEYVSRRFEVGITGNAIGILGSFLSAGRKERGYYAQIKKNQR